MLVLKSLADFRRFLALPGATIQLIRHDRCPNIEKHAEMWKPRKVAKLQTNAVKFTNNGWLHWDGKLGGTTAKSFRWNGSNIVTVELSHDGSFSQVFQYECSIEKGAA